MGLLDDERDADRARREVAFGRESLHGQRYARLMVTLRALACKCAARRYHAPNEPNRPFGHEFTDLAPTEAAMGGAS
jgi:hypothetical protein